MFLILVVLSKWEEEAFKFKSWFDLIAKLFIQLVENFSVFGAMFLKKRKYFGLSSA